MEILTIETEHDNKIFYAGVEQGRDGAQQRFNRVEKMLKTRAESAERKYDALVERIAECRGLWLRAEFQTEESFWQVGIDPSYTPYRDGAAVDQFNREFRALCSELFDEPDAESVPEWLSDEETK